VAEERVALITGSATGLGAVLIRSFAEQGYNVVINYLNDGEGDALRDEIASKCGEDRVLACQANVADRAAVKSMFDATIDKFGRVDVLVNCAGINRDAPFTALTDQTWDAVVDAHLKGHFVCGQEFVFHNTDREGVIINLGAAGGSIGRKNGANFCAAKAGVIVLTKCMALELAPRIRVNCLVPGSVRTREVIERYDLESDDGLKKELATLPMGRLGEFEDIAHMVHCIVNAKFTTGAKFYVNGGQYMH
jgi:3-oxoacyl-[acyl-carrier protein] reductase